MHPSALKNAELFFETYAPAFSRGRVVEIGSQDINGSIRSFCPERLDYLGLDFIAGKGVDIVLDDPYRLPLAEAYADIVVSSSCFEHSQFFWLVFLEVQRILKPGGLFYLNAPSNGPFHRYPVDCWRFYPDSGTALAQWARRNGYPVSLLESYVSAKGTDPEHDLFKDFVAVFLKDEQHLARFPDRMLHQHPNYSFGLVNGEEPFRSHKARHRDENWTGVVGKPGLFSWLKKD